VLLPASKLVAREQRQGARQVQTSQQLRDRRDRHSILGKKTRSRRGHDGAAPSCCGKVVAWPVEARLAKYRIALIGRTLARRKENEPQSSIAGHDAR